MTALREAFQCFRLPENNAVPWRIYPAIRCNYIRISKEQAASGCVACRVASPSKSAGALLPTLRAMLVMLQGIWFIQIAEILYTGRLPCVTCCMNCRPCIHHRAIDVRVLFAWDAECRSP